MAAYSAQIRTRAERKEQSDPERTSVVSYDCCQVDVLKLITEGTVVHRAGDDQEVVEDPLENKSVGDLPKLFCFFPGTQTLGSGHVMHTGSSGGAVGAWRASSSD
jgi:hypothetical protein